MLVTLTRGFLVGVKMTKVIEYVKENVEEHYKNRTQVPQKNMQELQLLLAEYKRKRICAYCGAKYTVKDFRLEKIKMRELYPVCVSHVLMQLSGGHHGIRPK